MRRYAEDTKVPVERTRIELEQLLYQHGADQFINGWDFDRAVIGFRMRGRYIRITLPLKHPRANASAPAVAQFHRARWRALLLVVKAKLEAIHSGIVTFEEEFLAHIVMPDNQTVGAHALKGVAEAYKSGKLPHLLPGVVQ